MLKKEDAQQLLNSQINKDWQALQAADIFELEPSLRKIAFALLGKDEQGERIPMDTNGNNSELQRYIREGMNGFTQAESPARAKILHALFPGFAEQIAQGWELIGRLPYQLGHLRKAFRLARPLENVDLHNQNRQNWLRVLITSLSMVRDKNVVWLSEWAPYLGYHSPQLGLLFAATIEADGPTGRQVFEILCQSASGKHLTGAMGRHVTTGLLVANYEHGWEFIEKLLLAAQREEGLRQVILETVDEAHPQAFIRMLRLILEHNLLRFSSVVRAVDVWFEFGWDSQDTKAVTGLLQQVLLYLENEEERQKALISLDGQAIYLALWTKAYYAAETAFEEACQVQETEPVQRRFAKVVLLGRLGLPQAQPALVEALSDPDLRIATQAFIVLQYDAEKLAGSTMFERLEPLLARIAKAGDTPPEPLVWLWPLTVVEVQAVADTLLKCLGERPISRLLPYTEQMGEWQRVEVARIAAEREPNTPETARLLLRLMGDRTAWVRQETVHILEKWPAFGEKEALELEKLLKRQTANVRQGVITALLRQDEQACLNSANRLLKSGVANLNLAGLELLGQLLESGRVGQEAIELAHQFQAGKVGATTKLPVAAQAQLKRILARPEVKPTLENGLGLFQSAELTSGTAPQPRKVVIDTPEARKCVQSLTELITANLTTPLTVQTWQGKAEMLLGNLHRGHFSPPHYQHLVSEFYNSRNDAAQEQDKEKSPKARQELLPLWELWQSWRDNRAAELRRTDGLELVQALLLLLVDDWRRLPKNQIRTTYDGSLSKISDITEIPGWLPPFVAVNHSVEEESNIQKPQPEYGWMVQAILEWLLHLNSAHSEEVADLLLDVLESTLAAIPPEKLNEVEQEHNQPVLRWRANEMLQRCFMLVEKHLLQHSAELSAAQQVRLWRLYQWYDQPFEGAPRAFPPLWLSLLAYQLGTASEADLIELLLGQFHDRMHSRYYFRETDWGELTERKPTRVMEKYPILQKLMARLRQRVLEVELARGELATPATKPALKLSYSGGLDIFIKLLAALGLDKLVRKPSYDESRAEVFSHLLKVAFPDPTDNAEELSRLVQEAGISETRLVEAAIYAPQWAGLIEKVIGWACFEQAVWWLYAHTKDTSWSVSTEVHQNWKTSIAVHTPLKQEELLEGGVDVEWFGRFYAKLGETRWLKMYEAAKYASSGIGHNRARIFADAMLGRVEVADLKTRIATKRNQDAIRAVGLVPLTIRDAQNQTELLERYKIIQEFVRSGRVFGAMRRESEALAARIGLANLARQAGYTDPLRLQWAMEALALTDLQEGDLTAEIGETQVTLSLDTWGEPQLTVSKAGKVLKALPGALKKEPAVVKLVERKKELEEQITRMRRSLEETMGRGDIFTGAELVTLLAHPLLAALLKKLVFVVNQSANEARPAQPEFVLGYPQIEAGQVVLRSAGGLFSLIEKETALRIAHPYDLLKSGQWAQFQKDCFIAERIQPFKQIFRELYVLTEQEKGPNGDATTSARYQGQQVQPRQAHALLGQRGWLGQPDYGEDFRRIFYQEGVIVWLESQWGYGTPLEVEGLTLDKVFFTRRNSGKLLPLVEVEPRLFSEVMRDLDLVVSVAHRGGVDPEASHSTVEMRAALVRETCELLKLENVRLQSSHALIEGELGRYSVHLGSATVHRQPGGALCIVPVHSQHRGRLFLPFADNDPVTAEVISKVLLLSRDKQIKDPSILEQIL